MSSAPARTGRVFAVYTGLRVLALVACYGVLLVLGVRGLLALAGAVLLSGLLSLLLLRGQRDAVTDALEARRVRREAERAQLRSMLDDGPAPR